MVVWGLGFPGWCLELGFPGWGFQLMGPVAWGFLGFFGVEALHINIEE